MDPQSLSHAPAELFADENSHAEELIDKGTVSEAARILVDVVRSDPQNWRAYNNMGLISWNRKAWFDAYTMFHKAVTLKPDYQDALINLFDAAIKLRRVDEVEPLCERALHVNPELDEIKIILESIREQGDDIYLSERALTIGTHHPKIEEGNRLLEEGQLLKAMETYLSVNDTEGPNAEAFCGLGIISYHQKRFSDAYTLFLESIKLNPVLPDTFLNLLDAAQGCDKLDEARKIYRIYAQEFPALRSIAADFGFDAS